MGRLRKSSARILGNGARMSKGPLHLVIASGASGGHFYPTLAIAREFLLSGEGRQVTLVLSGRHASEQAGIAARYGLETCEVPSFKLPHGALALLRFPYDCARSFLAARRTLGRLRPDVVLGMGSFAAYPLCQMASWTGCPLVLHEGNSFMGKTNRLLMRQALGIGLSLPLADMAQTQGRRAAQVGMPLREAIVQAAAAPESVIDESYLPSLGLRHGVRTILVFGGSQGARAVNELLPESMGRLPEELRANVQVMHLTGSEDNRQLAANYERAGVCASVRRGEERMEQCYLNADLVICRAGASSICELALFGKPSILIPLPTAADDHQTVNATVLEQQGAAVHLPQRQATPERLASMLADFLTAPQDWQTRAASLKALGRPRAARAMVDFILERLDSSAT